MFIAGYWGWAGTLLLFIDSMNKHDYLQLFLRNIWSNLSNNMQKFFVSQKRYRPPSRIQNALTIDLLRDCIPRHNIAPTQKEVHKPRSCNKKRNEQEIVNILYKSSTLRQYTITQKEAESCLASCDTYHFVAINEEGKVYDHPTCDTR